MIHNPRKPKVLILDSETTDFNADVGFMLCFCGKWLGSKRIYTYSIADGKGRCPHCRTLRRPTNDRHLIKAARDLTAQADIVVTWYGREGCFDLPYLRTRMAKWGINPLPPIIHWDGQQMSRKFFKMRANRLKNAGSLFGMNIKTDFVGPIWMDAIAGKPKAIKYIVDHCKKDVQQLEDVYLQMRPYMPTHPNLNLVAQKEGDVCPMCLSRHITAQGYRLRQNTRVQRYQCQDCGKWSYKGAHAGKTELR